MSTPNSTLRQRAGKEKTKGLSNGDTASDDALNKAFLQAQQSQPNEWDYKLALAIITILAFITRFFGISHPNEVVFDEVHFGKVYLFPNQQLHTLTPSPSSPPTIFNAPISSTFILPLESCSLPLSVGSLDTMAISSLTISENPILPITFLTSHFDRSPPFSVPLPSSSST